MQKFKQSRATTLFLNNLVEVVLDMAVEGNKYSKEVAKLCISINQQVKEKKQKDFFPLLLSECRETYFKRDQKLRGFKTVDGTRFTSFMCFLTELYGQVKQRQVKMNSFHLGLFSTMLVKCCEVCITHPIKCSCCSVSEAESVFFVMTAIGPDLEEESPQYLDRFMNFVRDGFLSNDSSANLKRILLQLIELRASNWQMPDSTKLLSKN